MAGPLFVPPMVGIAPTVLTYVNQYNSGYTGGGVTNWTFSSAAIGDAAADRIVAVGVSAITAFNTARTCTAVEIGGNAAAVYSSSNFSPLTAIAQLLVTSGTTANIKVTCSGNIDVFQIFVCTLREYLSPTPTTNAGTANATTVSTTVNTVDGGALLAVAGSFGSITSWTGVTQLVNNSEFTLAAATPSVTGSPTSVSFSGAAIDRGSVTVAAWR